MKVVDILLTFLFFYTFVQSEIMHEAEVMMKLDHPNIVRIIGNASNYLIIN